MNSITRHKFSAERNNETNVAGSFHHALTILCICNRQQNLPDSELLLEKVPKRIARQRFYLANSLNRAWPHKCIQKHAQQTCVNVTFGSKFV